MSDRENSSISRVKPELTNPTSMGKPKIGPKVSAVGAAKSIKDIVIPDLDDGASDSLNASDAIEQEKQDDQNKKERDPIKTLNQAVVGAKVATGTAKALYMAKMMLFLKNLLTTMLAMAQSLVASIISGIAAAVHSFVAFIGTIATMLGVATTVVALGSFGVVVLTMFSVGALAVNIVSANEAARSDNAYYDCSTDVKEAAKGANPANEAVLVVDQAKKVYSLFKKYGLHDYNIAGIVGNWSHESGIDSTSVEGIYSEPYSTTTPQKSKAIADLNSYTVNDLFPSYTISINHDAYVAGDGKYYPGIGLGQWTGPRGKMLMDYATGAGKNWYDLDLQLAFCIAPESKGGDTRSGYFSSWAQESSPASATYAFMDGWEGINRALSERTAAAEMWATEFASWSVDVNYANSIIAMSGSVQSNATNKAVAGAAEKCSGKDLAGTASGDYMWPTDGPLTSPYGVRIHPISGVSKFHEGIDIAPPSGTPVYATANGKVTNASYYGGYGNCVIIDLGDKLEVYNAHLSKIDVSVGQTVKKGDKIGEVGSTGNSTGPHLHFGFYLNGETVDPYNYVKKPEGIVESYD